LLVHLLFYALVAANYRALAFPVGSSLPTATTSPQVEYESTAREGFGDLPQTIVSKHSLTFKLQDHAIDNVYYDKGAIAIRHFDTPTSPKTRTKRSADLYTLRIPFSDQERYMALFLSKETTVPFCKDVSGTLYEDSENVFLHLGLRLGNSTTEIPVREDDAIGLCQKIRNNEQSGDGSLAPARTSSRFAPSTTAKESVVGSMLARPSEADKSTMTNTAKAISTKEILEPSEAISKSVNLQQHRTQRTTNSDEKTDCTTTNTYEQNRCPAAVFASCAFTIANKHTSSQDHCSYISKPDSEANRHTEPRDRH
jgi:hypothetical protein